ncbi:MAG: right-handed parallel beta-helix repeat-containing protein [Planctomycetota bacterium]
MRHALTTLAAAAFVGCPIALAQSALGPLTPPPGVPTDTRPSLADLQERRSINDLPGSSTGQFVVTEPGSYVLTGNISSIVGADALQIRTAGDVTIDLNGYSIVGVENGGDGINVDGPAPGILQISNGTITYAGNIGIHVASQPGFTIIRDVNVKNSGSDGIRVPNDAFMDYITVLGSAGVGVKGRGNVTIKGSKIKQNAVDDPAANVEFAVQLGGSSRVMDNLIGGAMDLGLYARVSNNVVLLETTEPSVNNFKVQAMRVAGGLASIEGNQITVKGTRTADISHVLILGDLNELKNNRIVIDPAGSPGPNPLGIALNIIGNQNTLYGTVIQGLTQGMEGIRVVGLQNQIAKSRILASGDQPVGVRLFGSGTTGNIVISNTFSGFVPIFAAIIDDSGSNEIGSLSGAPTGTNPDRNLVGN